MFARDDAKHPCTHLSHSQGFAVGRVERYPCTRMRISGKPLDMSSNPEFLPQSSEFLLSQVINLSLVILFFQISIDIS